jgi:hypothetical protein
LYPLESVGATLFGGFVENDELYFAKVHVS